MSAIGFSAFFLAASLLMQAQDAQSQNPAEATPAGTTPASPAQLTNTVSAPPFTGIDKFDYRVVQTFGLRGFVGAGVGAAIGDARNSPHEWGQGTLGFAKRYGSSFGGNLSRQVFATTLETAFHEDPRYFPSEEKSGKERLGNVLKQVIFTKTDSGGDSVAYGRIISAFGAAQLVNIWQPASSGSVAIGIRRGFITLGADAAYNLLQEYVPFTRPLSLRHRH